MSSTCPLSRPQRLATRLTLPLVPRNIFSDTHFNPQWFHVVPFQLFHTWTRALTYTYDSQLNNERRRVSPAWSAGCRIEATTEQQLSQGCGLKAFKTGAFSHLPAELKHFFGLCAARPTAYRKKHRVGTKRSCRLQLKGAATAWLEMSRRNTDG